MRNVKSKYARRFDSSCKDWESNNMQYNLMHLKLVEQYYNDVLKVRGYVFLRDIYEHLGIPVTQTALFVGWFYNLSDGCGDGYIDFDIQVSEDKKTVELDFNVDGDITNHFKD